MAELRSIVDEELGRLPESTAARSSVEGRQEEAAHVLGWSKGTVSGRLARAKDLLRGRLARRGLSSTGALLSAYLVPRSASAAVPPSLLAHTVRTAAAARLMGLKASLTSGIVTALAHGILRTMLLGRIKLAAALLLLALGTAAVAGPLIWNLRAAGPLACGYKPRAEHLETTFCADRRRLLHAGRQGGRFRRSDGLVRLWDLARDREVRAIDSLEGGGDKEYVLRAFAISPDGRLIAVGRYRSRPVPPPADPGHLDLEYDREPVVTQIEVKTAGPAELSPSRRGRRAWPRAIKLEKSSSGTSPAGRSS